MFRVLVTSACILFVILVAIVIANCVSLETTMSTPDKLESNLNGNSEENYATATSQELKAANVTNETNDTNNATEKNEDSINVASDISEKEVKVLQASSYGADTDKSNISAVINSKRDVIKNIKADIEKAEIDLREKVRRLKELEQRALTTRKLSAETQKQFEMLIAAMNVLQNSIIQTSKSANEAFWQAQLQTAKYNDAKRRYSKLVAELRDSKSDYGTMKTAVEQAMRAAKIAVGNIQTSTHTI